MRANLRTIFGLTHFSLNLKVQRYIAAVVMLRVLIFMAILLSSAWQFNTDDAYITLRYSRHLAQGQGIVWNVEENPPVEGYSNFLFVLLGAAAIKIGGDPMLMFKLIDSLALAISCFLLYLLARLWLGPVGATIPAICLTSYVGTYWWTVSGLETAVYQMLAIGAVAAFLWGLGYRPVQEMNSPGEKSEWSPYWIGVSGFLAFIAALTRPEGPIIAGSLWLALLADGLIGAARDRQSSWWQGVKSNAGKLWVLLLGFGLPYAIYFFWRWSYFQRLFPNTVYCKAAYQGDPLELLKSFGWLAWPYFCFALIGLRRRLDVRSLVIMLFVLFYLAILYGIDPIIGHLNRHFLAAFALLLVLASVGMVYTFEFLLPKGTKHFGQMAVVLVICTLAGAALPGTLSQLRYDAAAYAQRMAARAQVADWLNRNLSSQDEYLIGDTGLVPYLTHARVMDTYCLNCAEMTRPPINRSAQRFVDLVLARKPAVIVVHSHSEARLVPHDLYGIYPLLVQNLSFKKDYRHMITFGARGDFCNYWIFSYCGR